MFLFKLKLFFKEIFNRFFSSSKIFYINGPDNLPPPLSKHEEEETFELLEKGAPEAKNKLIEHNLRLVVYIAKKFESTGHDIDDLIGIGTVGLIKGIDTYSDNKKVKLATYAAKCAENEILMYFRADKKNNKNISIYEEISYDKEGNKITILDILKTPDPDFVEDIHKSDNI